MTETWEAPQRTFVAWLEPGDREAVWAEGTTLAAPAGSTLFMEGDRSERVVVVRSGVLRIGTVAATGDELLLAFRGPGDVLGDQAAIDDGRHGQTVQTVTDASLLLIPVPAFRRLIETRPGVSMALHKVHVARLREADGRRLEQATLDVATRVARRLAELDAVGDGGIHISQRELAGLVGASREAVTKAIARLRERGAVTSTRGSVTVTDREALDRACRRT